MPQMRVCVGMIVGVHGVKGAVRVKSFTEEPEDFASYGPLEDDRGRVFEASVEGRVRGAVIASLAGIDDRDEAMALKGTRLYVPRAALPEPEEDEFYFTDLIGLSVERPDGAKIGRVVAVDNFGAGDVIEIAREGAPPLDLPFTRKTVPVVDIAGGRLVVVEPPEVVGEVAGEGGEAGEGMSAGEDAKPESKAAKAAGRGTAPAAKRRQRRSRG